MTTYGTIPTSSGVGPNLEYLSRAKERIKVGLGTRQPWSQMFNYRSINLPTSFGDAISRIRSNLAFFRVNYAIAVLFILFLSLLWHPISLIVFVVLMAAWLFLYFLRDDQRSCGADGAFGCHARVAFVDRRHHEYTGVGFGWSGGGGGDSRGFEEDR